MKIRNDSFANHMDVSETMLSKTYRPGKKYNVIPILFTRQTQSYIFLGYDVFGRIHFKKQKKKKWQTPNLGEEESLWEAEA